MATRANPTADMTEECDRCDRQTPHAVRVEIRTESTKPENAQYSREPYRVSECRVCGATETMRMNDK